MTQAIQTTTACPECGGKTTKVKPITIESLVVAEARAALTDTSGFRFCPSPGCDIAYFQPETEIRISKHQVNVRIGQKETTSPRPVCYCFSHTVEEIEAEVASTGTSQLADAITEKCRQGLDRCEETNPQGRCCLGNIRTAMKVAQSATPVVTEDEESCCATPTPPGPSPDIVETKSGWRGEFLATGGAVLSAILSSVCCWLPLLLVGFGVSAGSVAGAFEAYRPALLGVTGLFLAGGFYLTYFRKKKCAPDSTCAAPNRKLATFNKVTLWVAAVVVAVFGFFPNYVGAFLNDGDEVSSSPATTTPSEAAEIAPQKVVWVDIEGMTCEACSVGVTAELKTVEGVSNIHVNFDKKLASLTASPAVDTNAILQAVERAGYTGRIHDRNE